MLRLPGKDSTIVSSPAPGGRAIEDPVGAEDHAAIGTGSRVGRAPKSEHRLGPSAAWRYGRGQREHRAAASGLDSSFRSGAIQHSATTDHDTRKHGISPVAASGEAVEQI